MAAEGDLFRLQKFAGGSAQCEDQFEREVELALAIIPMPQNAACVYMLNTLEGPARH